MFVREMRSGLKIPVPEQGSIRRIASGAETAKEHVLSMRLSAEIRACEFFKVNIVISQQNDYVDLQNDLIKLHSHYRE